MNSRNAIQDELTSLQSKLPLVQHPAYQVPDGYFDGLAAAVLARVKAREEAELSPLLSSLPKAMPYAVPASYFESNLQDLSALHTEAGPAFLQGIEKEIPYRVPAGYFENLPQAMLSKATQPRGRVVPLFARPWMRVATAAAILGAVVFGGLQLLNGSGEEFASTTNPSPDTVQVAQAKPPIRQEIKKLSTQELEQFVENVPASNIGTAKPSDEPVRKEAEALLKDVSVNEMETFLSALPAADEEPGTTD